MELSGSGSYGDSQSDVTVERVKLIYPRNPDKSIKLRTVISKAASLYQELRQLVIDEGTEDNRAPVNLELDNLFFDWFCCLGVGDDVARNIMREVKDECEPSGLLIQSYMQRVLVRPVEEEVLYRYAPKEHIIR